MENMCLSSGFGQLPKDTITNGELRPEYVTFQDFREETLTSNNYELSNTLLQGGDAPRMPLDLSSIGEFGSICNLEVMKNEVPYIVKYKLHDGKHVKIWQCKTCLKQFGHQYTLMRHLPTHTDERKFQCNTCGKAFRQMSTLSQHKAIHSHERPYICEICQKTFNRVSTLISHRKTHTGIKPHQCHLCNKAFHQKGNLRNHIFTHTNERPYKCDDCGKGFNQMSNLMCHKLKICGATFGKRMTLRSHEQYEHKENTQTSESYILDEQKTLHAVFVESIKTKAMQVAMETNQIPFALLRPSAGIPVLVRVLPAGNDKQMLVPASAEDLKKHGQISVTPKITKPEGVKEEENMIGSTVQIKIPVVATVIQQTGEGGHVSMSVVSPGPEDENFKPSATSSLENYFLGHETDDTSGSNVNLNSSILSDIRNLEDTINNNADGQADTFLMN